jgi:hypothetical protein
MKHLSILTLLVCLFLTSCIVEDDDGFGNGDLDVTIHTEVERISVGRTCEGSDGLSGEAEVYSRLLFYRKKDWFADLVPVDSTPWLMNVMGQDTEINNPGLSLTVDMKVADGNRILIVLESYELDPNGVHDYDKSFLVSLGYQEDVQCWTDLQQGDCILGSDRGSDLFHLLMDDRVIENGRCFVGYNWRTKATKN